MKKRHEKRVAAQKLALKSQRDCDVCAPKYAITHRWPAAKDGEGVFMSYKLEERKRKAEDENNDGDRKKKARGESDKKSNGKQLSV
eukprot:scaffold6154_cov154-Amphora_coffeaeformis.AAC.1